MTRPTKILLPFIFLLLIISCADKKSEKQTSEFDKVLGIKNVATLNFLVSNFENDLFVAPEKRNLGMVFQSYAVWPHMNVFENIAYPLRVAKVSKSDVIKRVNEILDIVELRGLEKRMPNALSGGQQQRVSIARAIGHNPKVVFADEPTANLDSATSELVLDAFLDLHRQGQTIVMVTHEPEYAVLAERIIDLDDGVIDDDYLLENGKRVN